MMNAIRNVLSVVGICFSLNLLHAQIALVGSFNGVATPVQTGVLALSGTNISSLNSFSDEQLTTLLNVLDATPTIPASALPRGGMGMTCWSLQNPKMPPLPGDTIGVNVWLMSDGSVLLDDESYDYTAASATSQAAGPMRMSAMASGVSMPPGFGDLGSGGGYTGGFDLYTLNTNLLWLQISNVVNGSVYLNLMNATDYVYEIICEPALTTPGSWSIAGEVFPTNTSVMPFTVAANSPTNLFIWAQDWTGVRSNGLYCWWTWLYFGNLSETATDLDSQGNTLGYDYTNGLDPNAISFTIVVTNDYVNSSSVAMQLAVAGYPYYLAVLVDDNNYADAVWNTYASSNIVVNLGTTGGWHDVWVGLRGHGDAPSAAVWQWVRLKLDFTPPVLVITNPVNSTVTVPLLQLMGYSTEALANIRYDLSNGAGTVTNRPVMIIGQTYNTNTMEFVTNFFQAFDLPLANGTNAFTLHATDLAGNVTTITTNIIYSANTNPPVMSLVWPQNGMQISAGSFTIQGQVNDPTATVSAMLVDANGNRNWHDGLTGRDGNFWVQNVSVPTGTNSLSLTLSNGSGSSTTNFTIIQNNAALTINPVSAGDTLVGGTIGVSGYTVWANGVQAAQSNGNWTAQIASVGVCGGVVNVTAIPNSGNGSYGSKNAGSAGGKAAANPSSAQSLNTQATVPPPQGAFISTYECNDEYDYLWFTFGSLYKTYTIEDYQDGQTGSYTSFYLYTGYTTGLEVTSWPGADWPQMPTGPSTDISGYVTDVTGTNWNPLQFASTNVGIGGPEFDGTAHCSINTTIMSSPGVPLCIEKRTDDAEIMLATGGPLGSKQQNLWVISASAQDMDTGQQIPYNQISIGGFGTLDTNGNLYVVLPDNDPDTITPHVDVPNYAFGVAANEMPFTHLTEYPALTDTNRARLNVGVGEQVDLSGMPGNTVWSVSGGGLSATNGGAVTFTATSNAPAGGAPATVTAQVNNDAAVTLNFNVFPPGAPDIVDVTSLKTYDIGSAGAGMNLQIYYGPLNVSFYRVSLLEVGENASNIQGYFANTNLWTTNPAVALKHNPNSWTPLDQNNSLGDQAFSQLGGFPQPWSVGQFTWVIPNEWEIGNGPTNSLPGCSQTFTIDSSGTVTISKLGRTVTRSTNEVSGTWQ
jgi:hypothetical protein